MSESLRDILNRHRVRADGRIQLWKSLVSFCRSLRV
jgi:hypothetical protein